MAVTVQQASNIFCTTLFRLINTKAVSKSRIKSEVLHFKDIMICNNDEKNKNEITKYIPSLKTQLMFNILLFNGRVYFQFITVVMWNSRICVKTYHPRPPPSRNIIL